MDISAGMAIHHLFPEKIANRLIRQLKYMTNDELLRLRDEFLEIKSAKLSTFIKMHVLSKESLLVTILAGLLAGSIYGFEPTIWRQNFNKRKALMGIIGGVSVVVLVNIIRGWLAKGTVDKILREIESEIARRGLLKK